MNSTLIIAQEHLYLRRVLLLLGVLLFPFTLYAGEEQEKPMVIIIPSYNNIQWHIPNLQSILSQNYSNYRVIYIDDCSNDGTAKAVEDYLRLHDSHNRVTLIKNYERVGAMANLYGAIHSCKNDEIAVLVDGDDFLYHTNVLKQLNQIYSSSKEIWFTHGTLMEYPMGHVTWCEPIPEEVMKNRSFRHFKCPSHLRTFYTWLFKKIRLQDFLYKGEFLKMAWDMAIMYPLLEMAEERHAFVAEVNYSYNMSNPINDNKVDADLQNFLDKLIRARPSYSRLENKESYPQLQTSFK